MDDFLASNGSVPHDVLAGTMSPLTDYGDCGDASPGRHCYFDRK